MQQAPGEVEAALDAGGIGKEAAVQVGLQPEALRHRRNGRLGVQVLQPGKEGQVLPAAEAAVKTLFVAGDKAQVALGLQGPGLGVVALDEDAALGGRPARVAMSFTRVVLPEPLGPTRQRPSPASSSKAASFKAQTPGARRPVRRWRSSIWGKYLLRRLTATAGVLIKTVFGFSFAEFSLEQVLRCKVLVGATRWGRPSADSIAQCRFQERKIAAASGLA